MMHQTAPVKSLYIETSGFSLVEILLTLVLLGMLMLSITNMLIKANSMSSSIDTRYQAATEIQAVILDIIQDLQQGAYISNNSHKYRLEYTTYNASGTATKKVYGICYATTNAVSTDTTCGVNSGANTTPYLKLSTDGGSTWGSPYRLSSYDVYQLSGTPVFLYAQDANNCTSFVDTDANGVWLSGTDAAGAFSDCGSYDTSSPVLTSPNQATKIVLSGFQFTTGTGTPVVTRGLPSNIFMLAPQGVVVSTASAVSPGVKDSPLVKSFDTDTANSLFGASFNAYGIQWDPSRQRLLTVGTNGSIAKIFQVDRTGVLIGPGLPLSNSGITADAIALLDDGTTVMVLDFISDTVFWYSLTGSLPLTPFKTLVLSNPSTSSPALAGSSSLVTSPRGLLYDPKYPTEIFVQGIDPADSAFKIFEIDTTTGSYATTVLSGGKVALPAAIDATHLPFGLSQEPTTGDFLITRDYVNGSAPNHTIDIYRITSSGSSSSFSVNIDDLGSTATTSAGGFALSYSSELNHLFFSDVSSGSMYEVYPDRIITPRS